MKITKERLKQIISEEIDRSLANQTEAINECARCGGGCGCGGAPQVTDNQRLMDIENLFMQIQDVIDQMDDPMIGREVLQSMATMPVAPPAPAVVIPAEEPLEE